MTKPSQIRSKIYLFIKEKCGATLDQKVWHDGLKELLVELASVENELNQAQIVQLKNEVTNKSRTIRLLEQNIERMRGGPTKTLPISKPSVIEKKPEPKKYGSLAERMAADLNKKV